MKYEWLTEESAAKRQQILVIEFALFIKLVRFFKKCFYDTKRCPHCASSQFGTKMS